MATAMSRSQSGVHEHTVGLELLDARGSNIVILHIVIAYLVGGHDGAFIVRTANKEANSNKQRQNAKQVFHQSKVLS